MIGEAKFLAISFYLLLILLLPVGLLFLFLLFRNAGLRNVLAGSSRAIVILLIVGLVITNLASLSRINELEDRIGSIEGGSINRHNQLMSAIGALSNKVESGPEPARYLASQNYEYKAIDVDSAEVHINLEFAKLPTSSKVRLLYKDAVPTADDWTSITPTKVVSLAYRVNVTLSSDKNYAVKVVVEAPSETISEPLQSIDLLAMMEKRIFAEFAATDVDRQGNLSYILVMSNHYLNNEDLKAKSIVVKVYYNEVLIQEEDITNTADRHQASGSEKWDYQGRVNIGKQSFDDQLVTGEIIVTDGLGKEYVFRFPRYQP